MKRPARENERPPPVLAGYFEQVDEAALSGATSGSGLFSSLALVDIRLRPPVTDWRPFFPGAARRTEIADPGDLRLRALLAAPYCLVSPPTRISIGEPYGVQSRGERPVSFRRSCIREGVLLVRYLSDVNLRAVLAVLINRAGGTVEIANTELYDAMLPDQGRTETFLVEETSTGLRLSLVPQDGENTRSR